MNKFARASVAGCANSTMETVPGQRRRGRSEHLELLGKDEWPTEPPLPCRNVDEVEMAKQVTVESGTVFGTLTAAKEHFNRIREATPPGSRLSGSERTDVLDIYRRYCAATNWPAEKAVDVTTEWDNEQRPQGTYAKTKAFAVVTASGSTKIFSMDKALTAIAV